MLDNALIMAVGKLRTTNDEINAALEELIQIALRQRQALLFYATPGNYIDGVPHLQMDGCEAPVVDDGSVARYALGEDGEMHVVH